MKYVLKHKNGGYYRDPGMTAHGITHGSHLSLEEAEAILHGIQYKEDWDIFQLITDYQLGPINMDYKGRYAPCLSKNFKRVKRMTVRCIAYKDCESKCCIHKEKHIYTSENCEEDCVRTTNSQCVLTWKQTLKNIFRTCYTLGWG